MSASSRTGSKCQTNSSFLALFSVLSFPVLSFPPSVCASLSHMFNNMHESHSSPLRTMASCHQSQNWLWENVHHGWSAGKPRRELSSSPGALQLRIDFEQHGLFLQYVDAGGKKDIATTLLMDAAVIR